MEERAKVGTVSAPDLRGRLTLEEQARKQAEVEGEGEGDSST